jgi:hypothetical protein
LSKSFLSLKKVFRFGAAVLFTALVPFTAMAQSAPPAPAAGPSLSVTLQFIMEKINEVGPITKYGGSTKVTTHILGANPDSCSLSGKVQFLDSDDASMTHDEPRTYHLSTVYSFQVLPQKGYTTLFMLTKEGKEIKVDSVGDTLGFDFHDSDMATRVGKAFVYAAKSCQAKPEPF